MLKKGVARLLFRRATGLNLMTGGQRIRNGLRSRCCERHHGRQETKPAWYGGCANRRLVPPPAPYRYAPGAEGDQVPFFSAPTGWFGSNSARPATTPKTGPTGGRAGMMERQARVLRLQGVELRHHQVRACVPNL